MKHATAASSRGPARLLAFGATMSIAGLDARRSRIEAGFLIAVALLLAGCTAGRRPSPAPALPRETEARLALDPSLSPVEFRWLSDDTVLVAPSVGKRKLASFGNYLERAARKRERVRLAVWDDEAAWNSSREASTETEEILAHKRALYVKNMGGPAPVDHYRTFGTSGEIVYERDFRTWPLSETDAE